jgi:hypothetical protein
MAWTVGPLYHTKNSWMGSLMAARDDGHSVDTTAAPVASN